MPVTQFTTLKKDNKKIKRSRKNKMLLLLSCLFHFEAGKIIHQKMKLSILKIAYTCLSLFTCHIHHDTFSCFVVSFIFVRFSTSFYFVVFSVFIALFIQIHGSIRTMYFVCSLLFLSPTHIFLLFALVGRSERALFPSRGTN